MISRAYARPVLTTVAIALACALTGCGRRVVVHPSRVAAENDPAWTVKSEPKRAPPPISAEDAGARR